MGSVMSLQSVVKTRVKKMILENPKISVDEIQSALEMNDHHLSRISISLIRGEFRHSLRFLIEEGLITASAVKHKEIKERWGAISGTKVPRNSERAQKALS
jgi:hypothetical protein